MNLNYVVSCKVELITYSKAMSSAINNLKTFATRLKVLVVTNRLEGIIPTHLSLMYAQYNSYSTF